MMISTRSDTAPATPGVDVAERSLVYRPVPRPGRYITAALAVLFAAIIVQTFAQSPAMHWDTFARYFFDPRILQGLGHTLLLTAVAMVVSTVVGVALAIMGRSKDPTLRTVAWLYINLMRSIPLLVLILFTYFIGLLIPQIGIGIPFTGPMFWAIDTNNIVTPFVASIVALGLGQAAYTSEIVRGGILAVERGQMEAATALAMTPSLSMRRVVLPQAFRVIVPGLGNETIGMFKATSLVQVIGYTELLTTAQRIYALTFETIPLLLVATAWYLILTTLSTIAQSRLEKVMGRGY
jgi:polar amino acid transport system permease protein